MRILLSVLFSASLFLSVLISPFTSAHQLSTAYANLHINPQGVVTGEWQLRLYDLEQAIGLDVDGDGNLLWQELMERADGITQYFTNQLQLSRDQKICSLQINNAAGENGWKIDSHFNENYLVISFRTQCASSGDMTISYQAFFAENTEHKALINLSSADVNESRVLSDNQREIRWQITTADAWASFVEFLYQGVWHIWIGLDHILFLLSLMLTCVLIRRCSLNKVEKSHWEAELSTKKIIKKTLWVVTAFTLAHSITLSLTALELIQLPSRWVEVAIAGSVLLVALNSIFPLVLRLGWLTFTFGLLHGMGFAGVLSELGLPTNNKILALLAFNLGVELGQLVIVLATIPLLFYFRKKNWYARYFVPIISSVIALVALYWLIERYTN